MREPGRPWGSRLREQPAHHLQDKSVSGLFRERQRSQCGCLEWAGGVLGDEVRGHGVKVEWLRGAIQGLVEDCSVFGFYPEGDRKPLLSFQ